MIKALVTATVVFAALVLSMPAFAQVDLRFGTGRDGARVHVPDPFAHQRSRPSRCGPGQHVVEVADERGQHYVCTLDRDGYRDHD